MVPVKLPMLNYPQLSHHPQQRLQAVVQSPKRPIMVARLAAGMKAAQITIMSVDLTSGTRVMMIPTE